MVVSCRVVSCPVVVVPRWPPLPPLPLRETRFAVRLLASLPNAKAPPSLATGGACLLGRRSSKCLRFGLLERLLRRTFRSTPRVHHPAPLAAAHRPSRS